MSASVVWSLFAGSAVTAGPLAVLLACRPAVGSHDFVQGGKRGGLQTRATKSEKDEFPRERHRLGEQGYDRQRADVHRLHQPRMSRAVQGSESHPVVGTAVLAGGTSHQPALAEEAAVVVGWPGANPTSLVMTQSATAGPD